MKFVKNLKARFPWLYHALAAAIVLGSAGGYAAYERLAGDCCYVGSPCCYPGSPCCAGRH
jgi:hypothetical protein